MKLKLKCQHCANVVDEHRVYFGVVGPFCNVQCREKWINDNKGDRT